jgi:hypothetical protein
MDEERNKLYARIGLWRIINYKISKNPKEEERSRDS